jgi:hypothetical protein
MNGGHGDGSGINPATQLFDAAQRFAAKLPGNGLRAREIGIHHGDQLDAMALLLQLMVDAGVVLAE